MFSMSGKTEGIFQFGEFQVDALARSLRRGGTAITLNYRAFDVLFYFVQNPGKALTRDELLKNVWPDTFVDEHSLEQSISVLRRALAEKPGDNRYIVTLPGRGYQFVSAVQAVASKGGGSLPELAQAAPSSSDGLLFQKHTIQTSVITSNKEQEQLSLPVSRSRPLGRLVVVLAVVAASLAGVFAWKQFHAARPLTHSPAIRSTGL